MGEQKQKTQVENVGQGERLQGKIHREVQIRCDGKCGRITKNKQGYST